MRGLALARTRRKSRRQGRGEHGCNRQQRKFHKKRMGPGWALTHGLFFNRLPTSLKVFERVHSKKNKQYDARKTCLIIAKSCVRRNGTPGWKSRGSISTRVQGRSFWYASGISHKTVHYGWMPRKLTGFRERRGNTARNLKHRRRKTRRVKSPPAGAGFLGQLRFGPTEK